MPGEATQIYIDESVHALLGFIVVAYVFDTCGDVGIERAVIIPKALYSLMLSRLAEFARAAYKDPWLKRWATRSGLQGFLARRCSPEFLALYLAEHPDLLTTVSKPGLLLNSVPEVDLAVRLHELGLLPEIHRKTFVETVSEYALNGEDLYGLDDDGIQSVYTEEEFVDFKQRVRTELVPRLDDIRRDWQSNFPSDDQPESHIQPLLDSFEAMKRHFAGDESAVRIISREIERAGDWIVGHRPDDSDERPQRKLGKVAASDRPQGERSIFDDVDA